MTENDYRLLYDTASKRIEELEQENKLLGERCNQLLKDKGELTDKIADIKANCDLAIEGRDIKIKELEKENAELRAKYLQATDEGTSFAHLKSLERENTGLKKENAELKMGIYGGGYEMLITKKDADIILLEKQLKEQEEHHKNVCEILTNTHRNIREQLTKATEIIKSIIEFDVSYEDEKDLKRRCELFDKIIEEAKQFLKEIEK